jgi:hypothetical protein
LSRWILGTGGISLTISRNKTDSFRKTEIRAHCRGIESLRDAIEGARLCRFGVRNAALGVHRMPIMHIAAWPLSAVPCIHVVTLRPLYVLSCVLSRAVAIALTRVSPQPRDCRSIFRYLNSSSSKRQIGINQAVLSQVCRSRTAKRIFSNSTKMGSISTYSSNSCFSLSCRRSCSSSHRHGARSINRESQRLSMPQPSN